MQRGSREGGAFFRIHTRSDAERKKVKKGEGNQRDPRFHTKRISIKKRGDPP